MTEEEKFEELQQQIIDQLEAQGLDTSEFAVRLGADGDIMPLNDINDYKTEYSPKKTVTASGYAGNQPSGGIQFKTGGGFYYAEDGGPQVTVSVSFPAPFKGVSFGIGMGVVKNTSGVFVTVPETTGFYKCRVNKTYEVTRYIIYHRSFDEATWSEVWKEWSGGVNKKHIRTSTWAERIS